MAPVSLYNTLFASESSLTYLAVNDPLRLDVRWHAQLRSSHRQLYEYIKG